MKIIAVVCVFLVATGKLKKNFLIKRILTDWLIIFLATANPLYQNEEIGEEFVNGTEIVQEDNTEDWQLVPDTDGNMHLVDINAVDSDMAPAFNAATDVIFRLFTRGNPTAAVTVPIRNAAVLAGSNYNPALQTRFHIHGNTIVKIDFKNIIANSN